MPPVFSPAMDSYRSGHLRTMFFLRAAQQLRSYGPFTDCPRPHKEQAQGPGHRASLGACPNQKRKWSRSSIEFTPKLGLMAGCAGVRIRVRLGLGLG